jgi:SAM-dependent methyltransferase
VQQLERHAMVAAADDHWWYRGRRRIVRVEIETLDLPAEARLLDAGCGAGQTLDLLSEFGSAIGIDLDAESVARAAARGHQALVAALPDLPFADRTFHACTCLDVLEHIPDDEAALAELARVTTPGGSLVVTVPAYEALWSDHDVANEHVRRYRARMLKPLARRTGWAIERVSYFNTVLLAPAAMVRLAGRFRRRPRPLEHSDLHLTPAALNGALELPLRLEAAVLRSGGRLPAGLSVLAVMTRKR